MDKFHSFVVRDPLNMYTVDVTASYPDLSILLPSPQDKIELRNTMIVLVPRILKEYMASF